MFQTEMSRNCFHILPIIEISRKSSISERNLELRTFSTLLTPWSKIKKKDSRSVEKIKLY
jgi:hypothetical protein